MNKIILFLILNIWSIALYAIPPVKIKSVADLPINQAIEAVLPNGELLIAGTAEQAFPTGISRAMSRGLVQEMATTKAKAMLADYIHGSTFEKTNSVSEKIKIEGTKGSMTSEQKSVVVQTMRKAALKGVDILQVSNKNPNVITVSVGLSMGSMQVADNFKDRVNNFRPKNNIRQNSNNSTNNNQGEQINWVHPMLR